MCTNHSPVNMQRVELAEKSRAEINELMTSHGFTQKDEANDIQEETEQGEETGTEKPNEKIEF